MSCGRKLKKKIAEISGKVDDAVKQYAGYALNISTNIKSILDSPVGDLVTAIIPGSWDNELKDKASKALAITVDALGLTKGIAEESDLNMKIKMFMSGLSDRSPEFKESQLKKVMDLLTKYMDGGRLKDHEYEAATMGTFITALK